MFRKLIVVMALLVVLTPGSALAVQYPPTSTPTTTPPTTCPDCPPPTTCPDCPPPTTCPDCPPPTTCPGCPPGAATTLLPGGAATTLPGGAATSLPGGATTTTLAVPGGPDEPGDGQAGRSDGRLPRTGADTIALMVRIAVVLLVIGFVLYLAERNRRAAGTEDDPELGTA